MLIGKVFSQQSRIFNYAFSIWEFKKLPLEILIGIAIWKLVCPDLIAVIAFLLSKLYIKLGNQHFRKRQYWLLQLTCACQELFGLTLFHSSIQIEFKLKVPIFLYFFFFANLLSNCQLNLDQWKGPNYITPLLIISIMQMNYRMQKTTLRFWSEILKF